MPKYFYKYLIQNSTIKKIGHLLKFSAKNVFLLSIDNRYLNEKN